MDNTFAEKFKNYINKVNYGALLIDDDWGSGKTHNIKKILNTDLIKGNLDNIEYYSMLSASNITSKLDFKHYILESSLNIYTDKKINLYSNQVKKYTVKKSKYGIIIDEKKEFLFKLKNGKFKKFLNFFFKYFKITIGYISSFFSQSDINPTDLFISIVDDYKKFIYSKVNLENIIFVIDDIERKPDNISLKEIYSKIIDLQEYNNIKIVIIMNSKELNETDKNIFENWNEKIFFSTIKMSLSDNYILGKFDFFFNDEHFKNRLLAITDNIYNMRILKKCLEVLDYFDQSFNNFKFFSYENEKRYKTIRKQIVLYTFDYCKKTKKESGSRMIAEFYELNFFLIDQLIKINYNTSVYKNELDCKIKQLERSELFYNAGEHRLALSKVDHIKNIISNHIDELHILISKKNTINEKDLFLYWYKRIHKDIGHFEAVNLLEDLLIKLKDEIRYILSKEQSNKMVITRITHYTNTKNKILNELFLLRSDIFTNKIKKDVCKEFDYLIDNLNKKMSFSIYENEDVIRHHIQYNNNLINDCMDFCLKNNIFFENGISLLLKCNEYKVNLIIDDYINKNYKYSNILSLIDKRNKRKNAKIKLI